jgi:uncharacterized membrane protein YphA (DoxX/SURF4 family)
MTRINGWACFFLVALRLVIGWHFLIEGAHKIHTHRVGKTPTNTPWSGEGFFREGYGPAAPFARSLLGLGEGNSLARLKVEGNQFPPALAADWQSLFDRFVAHYGLSAEQRQKGQDILDAHKSQALAWLRGDTAVEVKRPVPWGVAELKQTVPQRIAEYQAKLRDVDDAFASELPAFNKDVERGRLRSLKADAARVLAELNADLDRHTADLKAALGKLLAPEQSAKGAVPDVPAVRPIDRLDRATMWAHLVLGGCLLFGLFTRTASVLLALFLLGVTLVAPAVPFAPAAPGAVGHYLYINLYTIEMVALLALAAMPTGQWFGLDALIAAVRRRPHPRG